MLQSEQEHIAKIGEERFHKHLVLANMEVRSDARLVGLDKIREAIAFQAALQATGFRRRGLVIPPKCGKVTARALIAASEVFMKAIRASTVKDM